MGTERLDRELPQPAQTCTILTPPSHVRRRWAVMWFLRGLEAEDKRNFAVAEEAYRRALASEPRFSEASFNLGNVLRETDRAVEAEVAYKAALAVDPDMSVAWYNLADLQEERGELANAIASLCQAITSEPAFASAHFNLALCYQADGQMSRAIRHWRTYLDLEPDSKWAGIARRHIEAASKRNGSEWRSTIS